MVDHNEIGQGQAPDGILPTDLNAGDNGDTFLSKPVVPPDSSSEGKKWTTLFRKKLSMYLIVNWLFGFIYIFSFR